MIFLKFMFQFIILTRIILTLTGFRYHCIGKRNSPPCFIDVIPQEFAFRYICMLLKPQECNLIKKYLKLAEMKLLNLDYINRLLKEFLKNTHVKQICAFLRVFCKPFTYIKIHLSAHYYGAPGTRIILSNGRYSNH
uniref:Uncharacterized protein n=1 Tax=Strongyloides stercoralis TaxID=6248 RepID=A0A0K0E6V0_STRER